jgi:hypothetical protein
VNGAEEDTGTMAYARECIGCGFQYAGLPALGTSAQVTLSAEDGGTPSPWLPDGTGRIMDIGCKMCGAIFRWDYFGRAQDGRLGNLVALVRGSVPEWKLEQTFPGDSQMPTTFAPQRRAS